MAIDVNIPSQVKSYANLAGFPATGSLKTIFIAEDTNKTYRWTGSAYVEISATAASTWGAITGTLSSQTDLQTALNAKVTGNTAITGATKTKVTYDSKGLVTAGADATTADIADSLNKRYVTDANLTTIGNTSGINTGDQTLSGLGGVPYTGATQSVNLGANNLSANNVFDGFTSVVASGTLITLTLASTPSYLVTGSGGQVIKLPNATTIPTGAIYNFNNNQSSGTISVNNNSNTLVKSVPSGGNMILELTDNSTAAGSWDAHFQAPSNVSWSTNTFDYVGSITGATWNGVSIADNRISSASIWNAKQDALVSGTNIKTVNGTTILGSGDIAIASGITIGTTAITSGTVGRILFEGTGNVVQESANLFWDNTNGRLGIGTASPANQLHVTGSTNTSYVAITSGVGIQSNSVGSGLITAVGNAPSDPTGGISGGANFGFNSSLTNFFGMGLSSLRSSKYDIWFQTGVTNGGGYRWYTGITEKMTLFFSGNFSINNTTDAGFKLDVNGTARIATSLVINGSSSLFSSSLSIYQNSTNRAFSIATSTTKTSTAERILFSLNSNDATNQQAMDFGYIGASLINDRYFYLQTSESSVGYGGGVAIQHLGGWASVGSATQIASSVFHITSTTKGFLPPRMTTTQKNAIATPTAGLMVYDTTLNLMALYNGTVWTTL